MSEGVATIVGAIIGVGAAIAGAYYAVRFQARKNAEIAFHESVHDILAGMFPEPIAWPNNSHEVLQEKMPQVQSAVYKFRAHLSSRDAAHLDVAWKKYQQWCSKIDDNEIALRGFYQSSMPSVDQVEIFIQHVHKLLAPAKK